MQFSRGLQFFTQNVYMYPFVASIFMAGQSFPTELMFKGKEQASSFNYSCFSVELTVTNNTNL